MIRQFMLFIGIILLILFGSHFLVYFSLVIFFNITTASTKVIISLVLLFLALSFLLSSALAHWQDNWLTRGFYDLAGFWLGFLINLTLAILVVWFLFGLNYLLPLKINFSSLSIVLFVLALVYSLYGVWNAAKPQVKDIEVKMTNLPVAWQDKTIVQLSDLHLGYVHRRSFLAEVVEKTNAVKPEAVVITGDLFDGMDGDVSSFINILDNLQAPAGVFFITGNHETYIGVDKALDTLKKTKVRVLNDEIVNLDGLQLIGINYPAFGQIKDINNIIKPGENFWSDKPSILLYHTPSNINLNDANSHTQAYWAPNTDFTYVKDLGINLQLSGHTHEGQIFPFNFLARLIYNGYDYGLHTLGDFSIYTTSGVGTWGPPMRTGTHSEIVNIHLK